MLYIGETVRSFRTRFGEYLRAVPQATMPTNLLPDALTMTVIVFLISMKIRVLVFLVAMIAANDIKCASFPNLALFNLLVLTNALITFNAYLSLSDIQTSIVFQFFTPFSPVYLFCSSRIILCNAICLFFYTLFCLKPFD